MRLNTKPDVFYQPIELVILNRLADLHRDHIRRIKELRNELRHIELRIEEHERQLGRFAELESDVDRMLEVLNGQCHAAA